jgi:hypothetical protein
MDNFAEKCFLCIAAQLSAYFWEVVGLERGPLSLVRIIEELLEWKSSGSGSRKPR